MKTHVNAVLLAKLGWTILSDPDNIWVKVVSQRYLNIVSFTEARDLPRF